MRNFIKALLITVLLSLATLVGFGFFFVNSIPSCDEDSPGVQYARSLSRERLKQLYMDMERFSLQEEYKYKTFYSGDPEIPQEFSDLKVVKIEPHRGSIMVEGCFDHYMHLTFEGVGHLKKYDEHRRIVLNWGEAPPNSGTQVLWNEKE